MIRILSALIPVLFVLSNISFSQSPHFSEPVRLTNGNNDRNPAFKTDKQNSPFHNEFEFLAFERVSGNLSNICVTKIGPAEPIDSAYYITNDNFRNRNPSITYAKVRWDDRTIKYAMTVWESDRFGRKSIFASTYMRSSGWSSVLIVDSSNTDNTSPQVVCFDSTNFAITYVSGEDIKYVRYNLLANNFYSQANLTSTDSIACTSPYLFYYNSFGNITISISYERKFSSARQAVYFRNGTADSIPVSGNDRDTIAYAGFNINKGFQFIGDWLCIFESNRAGGSDIYASTFSQPTNSQSPVILNNTFLNSNYDGTDFPITDGGSSVTNMVYAYTRRGFNTEFIIKLHGSDSTVLTVSNDPGYITKNTMNESIEIPFTACHRFWFVFNKDSSSNYPSRIFGLQFTVCLTDIANSANSSSDGFYLSQNYPNPFNPSTKIKFQIAKSSDVEIIVYDVLGNEITTLVNEKLNPGIYETDFNGDTFSSGVYFYKLTTSYFTEIKKMFLIK